MKTYSFLIALGIILLTPLAHASDPIAFKKEQLIQKQLMLQNRMPVKTQKVIQKPVQPQAKPVQVAQVQAAQTPTPQQAQKAKTDLSAFDIRPMQAWKEELKVPSTSNDGIEILPHAIN